jgi:O-succinylhomoserine sulfhydrylase
LLKEFQTASPNLSVAVWLEDHPGVTTVRYPDLESHPQFDLAKRQMESGGTVVTLEVPGGTSGAFAVLNALELIDIWPGETPESSHSSSHS